MEHVLTDRKGGTIITKLQVLGVRNIVLLLVCVIGLICVFAVYNDSGNNENVIHSKTSRSLLKEGGIVDTGLVKELAKLVEVAKVNGFTGTVEREGNVHLNDNQRGGGGGSKKGENAEDVELSDKAYAAIAEINTKIPPELPWKFSTMYTNTDARSSDAPRDFLYFLHIPKTAGQTFHAILRQILDYNFLAKELSEQIIQTWGSYLSLNETEFQPFLFPRDPTYFNPAIAKVVAPLDAPVTIKKSDIPDRLGKLKGEFIKRTMMSPQCQHDQACFNRGNKMGTPRFDPHFACSRSIVPMIESSEKFVRHYDPYDGLCGHMDTSLIDILAPRRVALVTFLREPFSRFMSWYNYLHSNAAKAQDCVNKLAPAHVRKEGDRVLAAEIRQGPGQGLPQKRMPKRGRCPQIGGKSVDSLEQLIKLTEENFEMIVNHSHEAFRFQPFSLPHSYSPEQFFNSLDKMDLRNYVAKAMSGALRWSYKGNQKKQELTDDDLLEIGKATLESAPFVGIYERWNDSIKLFLWTFGYLDYEFNDPNWLPGILAHHRNKTQRKVDLQEESKKKLKKMVHEGDWIDVKLYAYAQKLFERRFQQMMKDREQRLGNRGLEIV